MALGASAACFEFDLGPCVRRAGRADAAAIARLLDRGRARDAAGEGGERADAEAVQRRLRRGEFLVLDRGAGGVAAAVYVEMRERRGRIDLLAVAPELAGEGLGRRLLAVAEALCAAEGCVAVEIEVRGRPDELPPWYRSMGYHERGPAPLGGKSGQLGRCVRMSKSLP